MLTPADGFGRIDAGIFVEAAKTWELVKPQAWFDSPMIVLPDSAAPARPTVAASEGVVPTSPSKRAEGDDTVAAPEPTPSEILALPLPPKPEGSFITTEGISSTFEVTQQMLEDANFETLEHVTVRVWIQHDRRGDVEVTLVSPTGIESILAQSRRRDDDGNGFNGWKFMTLKHWEENPVGTWKLTVRDANEDDKIGFFHSWSLQLWGEVVDPAKAKDWHPAEFGEVDEEEVGSEPTQIPQKPKPTALLPSDHGGEAAASKTGGELAADPTDSTAAAESSDPQAATDEGIFDGIETLRKHTGWLAGAFLIVLLAALGGGGYFLLAARRKRARLFGMHGGEGGARGAYAPVPEDVPLSLMERGRRAVGMKREGESKELYDAFGDGPSDESDDEGNEATALRYHDSFLDDGDDEDGTPHASGSGGAGRSDEGGFPNPPAYRDDDEAESPNTTSSPAELVRAGESTSSGSWQDAADDVRRD